MSIESVDTGSAGQLRSMNFLRFRARTIDMQTSVTINIKRNVLLSDMLLQNNNFMSFTSALIIYPIN